MMNEFATSVAAIAVFAATTVVGTVHATITVNNSTAIETRPCLVTEVKLGGSNADYCAGYFDLPNSGDTSELNKLNAVTDGADWTYVYKTPLTDKADFWGLDFEVSYVAGSGIWTISWSDANGDAPLNLPAYLDIAALFKAGNSNDQSAGGWAYFLFDDELLTAAPDLSRLGTYVLSVNPGLSHVGLFVRAGTLPDGPNPPTFVPEPATMALLGIGLLGAPLIARRRRNTTD